MPCTLYILRCADGRYYTGTYRGEDIATRVSKHNNGHYANAWTAARRPVALALSEVFESITDAIAAERLSIRLQWPPRFRAQSYPPS
jgi:putative endonuclease